MCSVSGSLSSNQRKGTYCCLDGAFAVNIQSTSSCPLLKKKKISLKLPFLNFACQDLMLAVLEICTLVEKWKRRQLKAH